MCEDNSPFYRILWTPWRMKYIVSHSKEKSRERCVFCEAPRDPDERRSLVLYKGRYSYVILNKYPYNTAHTMVIPYRHVATPEELTAEELYEMSVLTRATIKAIREEYRPHGFNIGANIGEAAGAGIAGHFHIHIVPRWCGDTNYMLILSRAKLVPESLERTWERLQPRLAEVCKEECKSLTTSSS